MEAKAIARTVRIAPRKVRLVVDLVRGKSVAEAASILRLTPKASSVVVEKVLKSATANAVNNLNLDQSKLYIKEAYVDEGPTLKRYRPRAKGSAGSILKRTSHITIVLEERN
ncbi:MAG TPA: 50S ribosomal protein L22 [Acholeplasmataceae bacterium]|jgi:large subunit ribosomal protein L22|nr:50S ribosomal protein L22 [Acholeplasmataceae bacterium]